MMGGGTVQSLIESMKYWAWLSQKSIRVGVPERCFANEIMEGFQLIVVKGQVMSVEISG